MWSILLAFASGDQSAQIDAIYNKYSSEFPTVQAVSAPELQQWMTAGKPMVLLDVRPKEERAVSTLKGAISLEEFSVEKAKGKTVVTYCTIGVRSGYKAKELSESGLDVVNFAGSLLAWTQIGGELVNESGPTKQLHVYGATWDYAAEGYISVITEDGQPKILP